VTYLILFQNKRIRQFRPTPDDIKERDLIARARDAEFAKIIDYELPWKHAGAFLHRGIPESVKSIIKKLNISNNNRLIRVADVIHEASKLNSNQTT
jgi:hypothetical protein